MTPLEAARILAKAAAFDQRTVGDSDILAWCEALDGVDANDALAAVSQHYSRATDRLLPAHVRQLVAEIGRERRKAQREALEASQALAIDSRPLSDRRAEIRDFVDNVRSVLPEGNADKLRTRDAYWRREQAVHRERVEEPNPEYDPGMAMPTADWNSGKAEPKGCWWEDEAKRERHALEELGQAGRLSPRRQERS
jgi:uncharacterized membrane protein